MDLAADAVFDGVAPPTRSAPARQQSKSDNGPSFDDHLESAAAEVEPPPRAEAAREAPAEDAPQTQETKESAAKAEAPTAPSEPAAPAFVVQIVTPPPAPTAPVETTHETTALAASHSETATPAPTAPQQPAQATEPVDGAPKSDASKADASEKAASPPAVNAPAAPETSATPSATAPPVAPATTQPVTQTSAAPAPPTETMQAVAATQTAPQAPREATPRAPKTAPGATEPKAEANATDSKSARIDAAQPKAAPPTPLNAARDGGAQTPAPAPISVDTSTQQPSPSGQSSLIQQAAHTQQTAAIDHNAVRAAPAAAQVAREIVRRFNGETTSFDLRLDPPELGRVEIRLEVTRDHRVTAVVAADSPQALAELARHARDLEQTLQSAGLELSDNGLSFDLRQGSEGRADADSGNGGNAASGETETEQPAMTSRPLGFERWRGVRVDMMV